MESKSVWSVIHSYEYSSGGVIDPCFGIVDVIVENGIVKNVKKELSRYVGIPISNPSHILKMQLSQNLGMNIPTHLSIPTNPAQLTLKVAKTVAKTIEKGYGM